MKIVLTFLFGLLLVLLAASIFALRDVVLAEPKYDLANWTENEVALINRAIAELGRLGKIPLKSYPYQLSESADGYVLRFRSYEFLRLRKSLLLDSDIFDGCSYFIFDRELKLVNVQHCG